MNLWKDAFQGAPAALVTLDNFEPISGPYGGDLIRMCALLTLGGTFCAYHGDHWE